MKTSRSVALFGLLLVAVFVAACSGGGKQANDATPAGIESAARTYTANLLSGDYGAVYEVLTKECRSTLSKSDFIAQVTVAVQMAKAFGIDPAKGNIVGVESQNVTGTSGEVRVNVAFMGETSDSSDSWETMAYEDGAWRLTDCDFGSIDGDSDSQSSSNGTGTTVGGALRSSGEVAAEEALSKATQGSFGVPVNLGSGVSVTLSNPRVSERGLLTVDVRAENRGAKVQSPQVFIRCGGSPDEGPFYAGSSYDPNEVIPTGTFAEGILILGLPEGVNGSACNNAVLFINGPGSNKDAYVGIDPAIVVQLKADS